MKSEINEMNVRELKLSEYDLALKLVFRVFDEFEAPDYTAEGQATFKSAVSNPAYLADLRVFGAFEGETLIGVAATRSEGNHVALFFVEGKLHKRGIGTALMNRLKEENQSGSLTVNSSPYATEIYKHLGFIPTDSEKTENGIRYTPMIFRAE